MLLSQASVARVALLVGCLAGAVVEAQDCGASNPCTTGCCSKFGFCGLGPDYCAKDICVANCDRKADCDPGGYGAEFVNHTSCPLNVCCSKWGFCGLTKDFCGDTKVKQPSCGTLDHTFERVVGYYETWAMDRPCNIFNPEKIPLGVYTHIIVAFATISPFDFGVRPDSAKDIEVYDRIMFLKRRDPDLKIFVALGGWAFNDPGSTRTTFSELASTDEYQDMFIKSLISFMSTYGFDGVDIDWEYPEADDRGGNGRDYEQFPRLLSRLKAALKKTGGRDGLSITIPASYWYLQHFDVKTISDSVDFFNVMSYDLHGVWDLPNKWVGPYLNAHTNLTEINDALDLLWRNDVPYTKVTMGLAFYGRGFTANSPACLTPGCTYGSGSTPRRCSHEVGILLNSEIEEIMKTRNIEPILYKDAAVQVITYDDDQWVSFDDEKTLALKLEFAKSKCLGGVMVWAISHDTPDAKYSNALGLVAKRTSSSLDIKRTLTGSTTGIDSYNNHEQCHWTNCGETCPAGFRTVPRTDLGAGSDELMLDGQGCEGRGSHTFCCPVTDALPACGWYDHNNGQCEPNCPSGYREVGSNNMYCSNSNYWVSYQAACCSWTVGMGSHEQDLDSMRLARQCVWGSYPNCDNTCPNNRNSLIALSYDGSGGARCVGGGATKDGIYRLRPLCCGQPDPDWQYTDCSWYKDLGDGPTGDSDCRSGCPADKVRVAMSSTPGTELCRSGEAAWCCTAKARTLDKRSNPLVEVYSGVVDQYIENPTCPSQYDDQFQLKRRMDNATSPDSESLFSSSMLGRRADATTITATAPVIEGMKDFVADIMTSENVDLGVVTLWNDKVTPLYSALTVVNIRAWYNSDKYVSTHRETQGDPAMVLYIICRLGMFSWNQLVMQSRQGTAGCTSTQSCTLPAGLDKRDVREYPWAVVIGGITYRGTIKSQTYRSANDWSVTNALQVEIYAQIFNFPGPGCLNLNLRIMNRVQERQRLGPLPKVASEHIIELQTQVMWYRDGPRGLLASDLSDTAVLNNPAGALDIQFFTITLQHTTALRSMPNGPGLASGGADLWKMEDRLMNALGSTANDDMFVLTDSDLNCLKALLWGDDELALVAENRMAMADELNRLDVEIAITEMRNVICIFEYLNRPQIHNNMRSVLMDFRQELRWAERLHAYLHQGRQVRAVDNFTFWMESHFRRMERRARRFVAKYADRIATNWRNDQTADGTIVRNTVIALRNIMATTEIDDTGFWDIV